MRTILLLALSLAATPWSAFAQSSIPRTHGASIPPPALSQPQLAEPQRTPPHPGEGAAAVDWSDHDIMSLAMRAARANAESDAEVLREEMEAMQSRNSQAPNLRSQRIEGVVCVRDCPPKN